MRMDHKGRMVLLAAAVLCLTLFVAVPAAFAAGPLDGYTMFQGTTYGTSLNKTAPVLARLDLMGSNPIDSSGNTLDTGPILGTTTGMWATIANAGAQGYYQSLGIVGGVWNPNANSGLGGLDQNWQQYLSPGFAVEANPDNIATFAISFSPYPTTLKVSVRNSKTGKAIKGAKIDAYGHTTTTAGNGKATLSNLAVWPGIKFSFKVSKSGYHTKTVKASAFPNGTRSVTVKLVKS